MIYISNEIFLGGSGTFNANNPLIGWHSILRPVDIDAEEDETQPGFPDINMWSPDTATYWRGPSYIGSPDVIATYTITLSNSSNQVVDYLGIARHNFGASGFTVTVQQSVDAGVTWTNVADPRIFPNNDVILYYFNPTAAGLFRIVMTKSATGSPAVIQGPIVAHIKLGRIMVLQRRIYVGHAPGALVKNVRKIVNISESGQYLGQEILRSYRKTSIQQLHNTPEFVRQYVVPFIDHVNGHRIMENTAPATFFFAWRPGDYPDEIIYGWTNDNIQPVNQLNNGMMSWSVDVDAIA